jgi:hypothetical protein
MKRYLSLRTAREIWSVFAKAFYDGSDKTQIFVLNQRAFSIRQSIRSLPTYYGELVEIFQELDYRDKVKMRDPEDIIMYKAAVEKLRIHIFLNGLDTELSKCEEKYFAWIQAWILSAHMHIFVVKQIVESF